MNRILTILLGIVILLSPFGVYASANLWEYYNGDLPSIEDRALIYEGVFSHDKYTGTVDQNIDLLAYLNYLDGKDGDIILGATNAIPTVVALFETTLASKISSSATSMTLTSAIDKDGTTLASSTYAFIIDEGSASEEFVIADCTGTACTNMTRGISVLTGTSTVASLQKEHRRGSSVKITNGPQLMILTRIINGIGSFPNPLTFIGLSQDSTGKLTYSSAPSFTNVLDLITKDYADAIANQGAATSTESVGGIVELATEVEVASSTATTANIPYVIQAQNATSTPTYSCNATGTTGALCVLVAENDGKLNQSWLDLTEAFILTGLHTFNGGILSTATSTFSATTTFNGSDVNNNAIVINTQPYSFPANDGTASSTALMTDGSGNLTWNAQLPTPRYTLVSNGNVTGTSATYATSSDSIMIPAGTMTASSTISFRFSAGACTETSASGTCTLYLRKSTGETLLSVGLGDSTASTQSGLVANVIIASNNSDTFSAQIFNGGGFRGHGDAGNAGSATGIEGTASMDFTSDVTLTLTAYATTNASFAVNSYSIIVNP